MLDQGIAGVIAAIITAMLGFIVGWMSYRQKADELFFKALDYLGGGSQKRNLGISAIELYWGKRWWKGRHQGVCVSLLSGSAIYLLKESGQDDAAHELHNLYRIMNLLLSVKKVDKNQKISFLNLQKAVEETIEEAKRRVASDKDKELQAAVKAIIAEAKKRAASSKDKELQEAVNVVIEQAKSNIASSKGLRVDEERLSKWGSRLAELLPKTLPATRSDIHDKGNLVQSDATQESGKHKT